MADNIIRDAIERLFSFQIVRFVTFVEAEMSSRFYELRPIKLGCQVFGIDLKSNISEQVKQVTTSEVTTTTALQQ